MQLNLYPSKYFLAFILLCHVSAMLIILMLPLQWWAMIIIETLLAGSFMHMIKKYIMRKFDDSIVALWLREPNWILLNRAGKELPATLLKDSTSSGIVVILNFKLQTGKRQSVIIFSDSVDKLSFSKLRRYLKTRVK